MLKILVAMIAVTLTLAYLSLSFLTCKLEKLAEWMTPRTISLEMVPRTLKMHSMLGSHLSWVHLQMSAWLFGQFYQELQGRAVCLWCLEGVCRCPVRWWASCSFIQQAKHWSVECYVSGTMALSIQAGSSSSWCSHTHGETDSLQWACAYEAWLCCGVEVGGAKPGHSEGRPGWWGGGTQRKDLPKKVELTLKGKTTASWVLSHLWSCWCS